ncbi:MAG: hypothetical protein ACI3ZB_02320 [Prevotella sp.]
MNGYSGSISIYFPCKLKSWTSMRRLTSRLRIWQQRQIRYIHHSNAPLTDLMDKKQNRNIMESFLSIFQRTIAHDFEVDEDCSPFGLKCLRLAYRKNREDNLFAKNVQIVLSRFSLEYNIQNINRKLRCEGVLLLNINVDNHVATLVVTLDFHDRQAIDLIYLKHIFFKRLLVTIEEHKVRLGGECSSCTRFTCFKENGHHIPRRMTFQDFINEKSTTILHRSMLAYDVDYRARYSFIELTKPEITLVTEAGKYNELYFFQKKENERLMQELYGIMMSDEGNAYVPLKKLFDFFENDYSYRKGYHMFLSGLNAMIVTKDSGIRDKCKHEHVSFEKGYDEPHENNQTEPIVGKCIPGVLEEYFPSFLKTVEIHYLINKITTNEIAYHERSFLYPWIFLRRLWLLWEILYDMDSHKYHINQNFHEAFGILKQLESIREEYNTLLNHTLSYSMALITVIAAMLTFMQLWK